MGPQVDEEAAGRVEVSELAGGLDAEPGFPDAGRSVHRDNRDAPGRAGPAEQRQLRLSSHQRPHIARELVHRWREGNQGRGVGAGRRQQDHVVLPQHGLVQAAQFLARLGTVLLAQTSAQDVEGVECLRLAPAGVQGPDLQGQQPLVQRPGRGQLGEFFQSLG